MASTDQQLISPLLAQILEQRARATADVTNRVIDNWERRALTAEATVIEIRNAIQALFDNPWMPNPETVIACLYPSEEAIANTVAARSSQ